jgi:hypothetical protein
VIPLGLGVRIGPGGEVVAAGAVEAWAHGPEPHEVVVWSVRTDPGGAKPSVLLVPAVLSGGYGAAFDRWWANEQASHPEAEDWRLEGAFVGLSGPWDAMGIGIDARYDNSQVSSVAGLWGGIVGFDE